MNSVTWKTAAVISQKPDCASRDHLSKRARRSRDLCIYESPLSQQLSLSVNPRDIDTQSTTTTKPSSLDLAHRGNTPDMRTSLLVGAPYMDLSQSSHYVSSRLQGLTDNIVTPQTPFLATSRESLLEAQNKRNGFDNIQASTGKFPYPLFSYLLKAELWS